MPRVATRRFLAIHPILVLATVIAALVFVGIAALIGYTNAESAAADNQEYRLLLYETKSDEAQSQYDKAANLWTSYAKSTRNRTHKEAATLNAAAAYLNENQYSKAIKMCQLSEVSNGITFEEAQLAAAAYLDLGQKRNAIRYYQEAIRLVPSQLIDRKADTMSFSTAIKELQSNQ